MDADPDQCVIIPAPWFSFQIGIGALAGLVFLGAALGFEQLLLTHPPRDKTTPLWLFHGFFCLTALLGAFMLVWSALATICRIEFRVDHGHLRRRRSWGPIHWKTAWPLGLIVGVQVRPGDTYLKGYRSQAKLVLACADNSDVRLAPEGFRDVLEAVRGRVQQLLDATGRLHPDAGQFPLGGTFQVIENGDRLHFVSRPMSPWAVPGSLYAMGAAAVYGMGIFGPLLGIAIWPSLRRDSSGMQSLGGLVLVGATATFVIGGFCLRQWIRGLAGTTYDVVVEGSEIRLTTTPAGSPQMRTWRAPLGESIAVSMRKIVDEPDQPRRAVAEIEILPRSGKKGVLMRGRPIDEIDLAMKLLRERLPANSTVASAISEPITR